MQSKHKLFRKSHLFLLLIISCNFKETKTTHEMAPQQLLPIKSNYERLKDTLSPVLERINRSAKRALDYEDDYDYGIAGDGDMPLDNAKSADCQFQEYGDEKELPFSNEYLNKSHMEPRYYEMEYHSIGRNYSDDEQPSPIIVYGRIRNVNEQNAISRLLQQIRNGPASKKPESLYEKYKATLDPIMKHFNATLIPPRELNTTKFSDLMVKNKNLSARKNPQVAYNSLYDEFKKRLIDFSADLGIDAGITNVQRVKDMLISDMKNKERHTNEEHTTSEFQKAQNLVESINKATEKANCHSKGFESMNNRKRENNYIQTKPAVQRKENGYGLANNDHKDEDCFRPLPFFRKDEEEEIKWKKRRLRGIGDKKDNQSYLTLNEKNPVLDGTAYNKFLTTVYAEPMDKAIGNLTARNLLEKVAGHMNLSTLDVAKKVASIKGLDLSSLENDPELHKILQEYIENSVVSAAKSFGKATVRPSNSIVVKDEKTISETPLKMESNEDENVKSLQANADLQSTDSSNEVSMNVSEPKDDASLTNNQFGIPKLPPPIQSQSTLSTEQVAEILKKLTTKLEEIQFEKILDTCQPLEDLPCKLTGSWQSKVMGLRFDITIRDLDNQSSLPIQARNRDLNVTIRECTPPRPHDVIELNWPITGSTLSESGGPFFLYTQKRTENLLATFVGYCRNCGGTDTIFGTWCISFPSKDCQDAAASFQTKNDILRRYKLEEMRNARIRKSKKH